MAFLTKDDFKTHLKDYVIEAISDNDEDILNEAIARAIKVATGYLTRYDTAAIFATTGNNREKYADLIGYIKDIAKWFFINLSNVLNDWEISKVNYKNAIIELGKIQAGKIVPEDWPYPESEPTDTPFIITSHPKRGNYLD